MDIIVRAATVLICDYYPNIGKPQAMPLPASQTSPGDGIAAVLDAANRVILGKDTQVRLALACLLARGHLLIEDLPGVGKTTLAHTLARLLGLDFQRIQFTSDMLPADILGVSIFDREHADFRFLPGPIFTQVVPRFGAMIGEDRSRVPTVSRWVLSAGEFANANIGVIGIGLGALIALVVVIATNPAIKARAYTLAHGLPVVGGVLQAREIAAWARLTSFALVNGVPILSAVALARAAVPIGPFRQGLNRLENDLKAGLTLDASLAAHTKLEAMDLSLLRAGQRSGAIGAMFGFMADNYENRLRDSMKRMTSLLEPAAIGAISLIVGFVALSLVLALSSVYEGVV